MRGRFVHRWARRGWANGWKRRSPADLLPQFDLGDHVASTPVALLVDALVDGHVVPHLALGQVDLHLHCVVIGVIHPGCIRGVPAAPAIQLLFKT